MFRERAQDLVVPVRKAESDRLEMALSAACAGEARFCVFDTLEGRTFALNLAELQAARFLWEPSALPPDNVRDEGTIEVLLRGRADPLEVGAADPGEVSDLFLTLDCGSELCRYVGFQDEDDELLQLNPKEVVWLAAPTHLLQSSGDHAGAANADPEVDA